jgi:hypothetical protein
MGCVGPLTAWKCQDVVLGNLRVKWTTARILGASWACTRLNKRPVVAEFKFQAETLLAMWINPRATEPVWPKEKGQMIQRAEVGREPDHKHQ